MGLHYTAFRNAIREDSRQTTPSRGVTQRKKFAVEANVESRVKGGLLRLGRDFAHSTREGVAKGRQKGRLGSLFVREM